ncbi:oxidoreductase domain-containing protein [Corynespora cassiicola Philippines]|uniref:Oxidoreductase domain-containing protein n=1 Tax=Corynespora cassiicola Philippines TaxID=1448308 RepID=A0A2T2NPA1_CORCC|nr:oxidoreductase domain-containing protein [Corynespora cassiicola Philippines]
MATPKPLELPEGFLDGPAPDLHKSYINFLDEGLPEYNGLWAAVLDGVMSEEECKMLVAAAEATTHGTWERAMINIGGGFQRLMTEERNCGRIIWDNRELAAKIWARVEASVPEIHSLYGQPRITGVGPARWNETWKVTRLNERLRFLKYTGGEYFRPHADGAYETPDKTERSYFTLHLYLNDSQAQEGGEELRGGATTFHSYSMKKRVDVVPKSGRVLLFQHRDLVHSGDDVISGTKYTMRTDIMFHREGGDRRGV